MATSSKSSRNSSITTGSIRRGASVSTEQHRKNNQRWESDTVPCGNCNRRISPSSTRCPVCGNGRCETCKGRGTVHVTRSRWIGGGKEGYRSVWSSDIRCDACDGTGSLDFADFETYSAFDADDLRDAQLERELLDDCEVAS
jgi:RecJ-like exonuclease